MSTLTTVEPWAIAPHGVSAMSCHSCKQPIAKEQESGLLNNRQVNCLNCQELLHTESCDLSVEEVSAPFLETTAVRQATWFHITRKEHWLEALAKSAADPEPFFANENPDFDHTVMVHLGTRNAASEREKMIRAIVGFSPLYLYEVRLNDDIEIMDEVKDDENTQCPELAGDCAVKGYSPVGVTRYVNRYEQIGSISLLANPNCFTVVSRTIISAQPQEVKTYQVGDKLQITLHSHMKGSIKTTLQP